MGMSHAKWGWGIPLGTAAAIFLRMPSDDEQRILVTQAAPGMVLAKPVVMPNRVVLCSAGMELSASVINHLLVRGIKRIYVKGCPLPDHGPDDFELMIRKLHSRFARVRNNPLMVSIQQIVEHALVRQR